MKLYKNLNVNLTIQDCGSDWLCGLRGAVKDIELVFNGLYNYGATSGGLEYQFDNGGAALATFWTDKKRIHQYFYNSMLHHRLANGGEDLDNSFESKYADLKVAELRREKETFTCFSRRRQADPFFYSQGTIAAERPDADFKDKVLEHAFANRDV